MSILETLLLSADDHSLLLAADLLRSGQLVAFPTETVYGLGADATNVKAVLSIFKAKGRPADNPLIVHIHDRIQLDSICIVPDQALPLMDAFWPGPLTILFEKLPSVPDAVTAGLPTVAVRMPSHPVAAALLRSCGLPVAAPSANFSGRPSPTLASHVLDDMNGRIPLILDGGPCDVGVESTVLDLCHGVPTILRPGGITKEKGTVVGYMEQHSCSVPDRCVYDELLSIFQPLIDAEKRLDEITYLLENHIGDHNALISEQFYLREKFERDGGLTYVSHTRSALIGLGFPESVFDTTSTYSGTLFIDGHFPSKLLIRQPSPSSSRPPLEP